MWALNSMTSRFISERRGIFEMETGESHPKKRGRNWSYVDTAKEYWGHQQLEETRKDYPLESLEGVQP